MQNATHHGIQYTFVPQGVHFLLHSFGDSPALLKPNGYAAFFEEGKRHRVGKPAVIYANGTQKWYEKGELKLIVYPSGARVYYKNGKFHRDDGPAIITHSGTCYWFKNGVRLTQEEFCKLK